MSNSTQASSVTAYLARWGEGDRAAFDSLVPLVEAELRRLARLALRSERPNHTLQPTALVNEAWLRLEGESRMHWRSRSHFLGVAAQLMRFILVDYARRRQAQKRGGLVERISVSGDAVPAAEDLVTSLELDDALSRLERSDARKARVATLRLFAGATVEETAEALGVSPITVMRDWRFARAWLQAQLGK